MGILVKYFRLSRQRRGLLTLAVLMLYAARILLVFLPLRTVLKFSMASGGNRNGADLEILTEIKWGLFHANRLSLWKNRCLVQSIAGRWMLQRRGFESKLSFGVMKDADNRLVAHAWLSAGDFEVVEKGEDYLELPKF